MRTIINVSSVIDYSSEPPIVTDSNPVTTVINDITPVPVITRVFYCLPCNCCCCCE